MELLQSSPTGLQSCMLWELLFLVLNPWDEWSHMGLRILTFVGEPLNFQLEGSPLRGGRVWDLIILQAYPSNLSCCRPIPPTTCCGSFFMSLVVEDLFWQVPVFVINGCSAVVILVCSWKEMSLDSFYPAILAALLFMVSWIRFVLCWNAPQTLRLCHGLLPWNHCRILLNTKPEASDTLLGHGLGNLLPSNFPNKLPLH